MQGPVPVLGGLCQPSYTVVELSTAWGVRLEQMEILAHQARDRGSTLSREERLRHLKGSLFPSKKGPCRLVGLQDWPGPSFPHGPRAHSLSPGWNRQRELQAQVGDSRLCPRLET